jgi:ABC-type transporter Mla subunit MlaD
MSNNANPNYFRLGVFVLGGLGVLIAVILIFGSGQIFKSSFQIETYLKQSVTGLDTGAAVRFRGVKIGQVTSIGLSGNIYEKDIPMMERHEYVVVRMQIFADKVLLDGMKDYIQDGLRARLKSMGITGVNYVELDFSGKQSTAAYPPLPFNWEPDFLVVPSLPNQADEIIAGIEKIVASLGEADLQGTQKRFDALLNNLNVVMTGDGKNNQGIVKSVNDLNILLDRIAKETDKGELNILMRELIATMTSLRQTVSSVQGDTVTSMENIKLATEQLNEFTRIASQSPASLIWGEPPPKITPPLHGEQK